METQTDKGRSEPLRCETCLYWEDFNGVCFCGASPYCADFTDGDDGCHFWQKKEPIALSPADMEDTTTKAVTVSIDDYGMTHCENCGAELLCNECGDMPDCCPQCGAAINWKDIEEA